MEYSAGNGSITVGRAQRINTNEKKPPSIKHHAVDTSSDPKNLHKKPFEAVLHNIENKEQKSADSKAPADWTVYTIKPGDTLWDLAVKRFHVSVDDLIKDNQIKDPGKLRPGKQIRVRMPAPVQETVAMSRGEDKRPAESVAAGSLSQNAISQGDLPLKSQVELKEPETDIIRRADAGIDERGPFIDKEAYQAPAVADDRIDNVNTGVRTPIDLSLKTQVRLSESEPGFLLDPRVKEREPYLVRSDADQPDESDLKQALMKTGLGRLIARIFGL